MTYSTLARWVRQWRERGWDGLVPRYALRGRGGPRIPEALADHFDRLYLDESRRRLTVCARLTRQYAIEKGLPCPSLATWRRHVAAIPVGTRILAREGEKAWRDQCEPIIRRNKQDLESNWWWNSDHHQYDIICSDSDGRIYRPWLTVWIDVHSGLVVGWYLSMRPSSTTIFLSFRRAALAHGLPWHILIDNGKDYRSQDFAGGRWETRTFRLDVDEPGTRALMVRCQITPHFANPYNARAKPVERFFLEVKEQFSKNWRSYCGGNPQEKPERLAGVVKSGHLPTLQEVGTAWAEWVEAWNQGACGQAEAPAVVYRRDLREVRRTTEEALMLLLMRTSRPLVVRRGCVRLFERYYEADELLPLHGQKVQARYDPEDLGRIYVFDLEDQYVCQARPQEMSAWGETEEGYRARMSAKRKARAMDRAYLAHLRGETADPMAGMAAMGRSAGEVNRLVTEGLPEPVIRPLGFDARLEERVRQREEELAERERLAAEGLAKLVRSGRLSLASDQDERRTTW